MRAIGAERRHVALDSGPAGDPGVAEERAVGGEAPDDGAIRATARAAEPPPAPGDRAAPDHVLATTGDVLELREIGEAAVGEGRGEDVVVERVRGVRRSDRGPREPRPFDQETARGGRANDAGGIHDPPRFAIAGPGIREPKAIDDGAVGEVDRDDPALSGRVRPQAPADEAVPSVRAEREDREDVRRALGDELALVAGIGLAVNVSTGVEDTSVPCTRR